MKHNTLKEAVDHAHIQEMHIDGIDARNPHESWRKGQFRKSAAWRDFCSHLIETRGCACERCGNTDPGLQVHHRSPEQYDNLNEELFVVLCGRCHLQIEAFCATEERMRSCPRVDRRFLTLKPYKETDAIVLGKGSGIYQVRKWVKEKRITQEPEKWIANGTHKAYANEHKREVEEAAAFMREHPELF
jgi:hypothetical protein